MIHTTASSANPKIYVIVVKLIIFSTGYVKVAYVQPPQVFVHSFINFIF
jgi:hypothetical protein